MQRLNKEVIVEQLAKPCLARALACVVGLMLAWQLIASAFHHHDLTQEPSNCVSCQIAGHFPADLPVVGIAMPAILWVLVYRIVSLPRYVSVTAQSYLIPLCQAPPAHTFHAG
jgi:hypothetical protein